MDAGSLKVKCPCGKTFLVRSEGREKKVRCGACKRVLTVSPQGEVTSASAAPPAAPKKAGAASPAAAAAKPVASRPAAPPAAAGQAVAKVPQAPKQAPPQAAPAAKPAAAPAAIGQAAAKTPEAPQQAQARPPKAAPAAKAKAPPAVPALVAKAEEPPVAPKQKKTPTPPPAPVAVKPEVEAPGEEEEEEAEEGEVTEPSSRKAPRVRRAAGAGPARGRRAVLVAGFLVAAASAGFVIHRFTSAPAGSGGGAEAAATEKGGAAQAASETRRETGKGAAALSPDQAAALVPVKFENPEPPSEYLSPFALVSDREGKTLYVAEATARQVAVFDVAGGKVTKTVPLRDPPGGLVLAPDGMRLYVTGASPAGQVHVIELSGTTVAESIPVGHTPGALAVSPDGKTLYVCNRFDNNVSIVDLAARKETAKVAVKREPVAAALTPDGRSLVVANLLTTDPANAEDVAACVSILDTATGKVASIRLPNGSSSLRGVCLSPDGQYAYVTHLLAHYQLPTTQLERGWMNTNVLSILNVPERKLVNSVLLDNVDLGASNPWGATCAGEGKYLCIAHAGTHEVSVVDRVGLHEKLAKAASGKRVSEAAASAAEVPSDLGFLTGLRRRLKVCGNGPRGIAAVGTLVYAAEYFSDSLSVVDIRPEARPGAKSLPLTPGAPRPLTPVRRGEVFFNDATRCFQKWQSCASCHPDVRADGLNWDLLNDGFGNPKNTRSLLFAYEMNPVMSLGVRDRMETAVRAGFKFIQFTSLPEDEYKAVDEYLRSLRPVPSPHLVNGELSAAAKRGQALFSSAACASCHTPPLYTDLKPHDVGLGVGLDKGKSFITARLSELWRTAPYLYDGRAADMKEVLGKCNPEDRHGMTSKMSPAELDDLIEFLLSL